MTKIFFQEKWRLITKDKFVQNCIKGYSIRFELQLNQTSVPETPLLQGSQTLEDVKKAIDNLLLLGAIRPCTLENSYRHIS